jgi:N utilization substance protein B
MISRRLLRVKTLKLLFSNAGSEDVSLVNVEKEMRLSLQKLYELYYYLLLSVVEVADYAEERINIGMQKHRPTEEEANPNKKFLENKLIELLRSNQSLAKYGRKHRLSWGGEHANVIRDLYARLTRREYYRQYMNAASRSFGEDRLVLKKMFMCEYEDNLLLENMLEEQCIWWGVEELGYALGWVLRTLDALSPRQPDEEVLLFEQPKSADKDFAVRLLKHSLANYFKYWNKAMQFVENWDADRVNAMDIMLIVQGFSEAVEFPEIPVKVTINEHVEIAKYYSTRQSHVFVNGVLDRMIKHAMVEGLIVKSGRGLLETITPKKPKN